jgi:sec-independent protein translocase protein TatA
MFDSPLKDGVIVLVILLLFFGPKRLPALSRAIGESVREFKSGIGHGSSEPDQHTEIPRPSAEVPTPTTSSTEQHTGA